VEKAEPDDIDIKNCVYGPAARHDGWLQGQVRMRAGLWENTVTSSGQTATRNSCITPEQEQQSKGTVESMRESVEKTLAKSGTCKLKEFTVAGGTQTLVMVCGKSTIKHVTTFHAETLWRDFVSRCEDA